MSAAEEHELADAKDKRRLTDPEDNPDEDEYLHANQYLGLKTHWGLSRKWEQLLFYNLAIISWLCLIAAAVIGSYKRTRSKPFIGTMTAALVLHWAAWAQTAFAMVQRASWTRDETIVERVQYLFYAIRLQRLMIVSLPAHQRVNLTDHCNSLQHS